MTDLQTRLAALSPQKRALFERLMREQARAENTFPISVLQRGIWFLEQVRPNNPAYVIPAALHLRGRLDPQLLRAALDAVVRRHESLRTTFELREGRPVQLVYDTLTIDLPVVDLRAGPDAEPDLDAQIAAVVGAPFDLATGPLLRLSLVRTAEAEHVLVVAMHHLISDSWSVGVLAAELSAGYAALTEGRQLRLPELAIQYGGYASWQHERLRADGHGDDLAYWRQHLAGAPGILALPTDRPRPPVQGFTGDCHPFELPEPLMGALGEVGRTVGATTYMALLAVFAILLRRYSGGDDIVVGVPMANRGRAEVEPLIGFFVNTLPVRTDLTGDPTFAEVVERVRAACLGAYAHQAVPFEKIVEELRPVRDLSRPPVFQVSLSYQSDPLPAHAIPGVELAVAGPHRPIDAIGRQTLAAAVLTVLFAVSSVQGVLTWLPAVGRAAVALGAVEARLANLEATGGETVAPVAPVAGFDDWQRLEFRGVAHVYPGPKGDRFVLGPLDFEFRRGEILFLVGANGSGKTTLVKVLTSLYPSERGAVLVDGTEITGRNRDEYRRLFSVVFADFFLFDSLDGLPGEERTERAGRYLTQLQLDHKVSIVGDRFSTTALSQGQRKRLALLAAYLEDRSCYVFDEWAADQDPVFKAFFYEELLVRLRAAGKAVVVISHDDRYFHVADRIVRLDHGQIRPQEVLSGQQGARG